MAHPAGDVEYLPAFQRGPRRGEDPGPVRLIYGVEGVPPDDLPVFLPRVARESGHARGEIGGDEPPLLHPVAGDPARDRVDQVVELQLGLLERGDVVEHALEQGAAALLPHLLRLGVHPNDVPVPVQLAEFKVRHRPVAQGLPGLRGHHRGVLRIGHLDRVPFDQFPVLLHGVPGQFRHAVGEIDRLKDVRHPVDGNPARDGVDDVLHLLVGSLQLFLQMHALADVGVDAVEDFGAVLMGFDRAVEVDPAVFPPPVVPQPVGVPHAAAAMVRGGDLFPQKPDVLRMHAQVVGLLPDRPDVLVGIAHDLIEGGVVEERHDFGPLDPVDAQPAGDAGKGLLQPLLQPVGALRLRPLLGDVPDVLDMRGPVPPVDELPAELVDAPVEGVAVLADEDVVPAHSTRVAEGAGGLVARDVVAAGLAAVRR